MQQIETARQGHKRSWLVALALACALVAGCGGSTAPGTTVSGSRWTTIGSRATPSEPGTTLTDHSSPRWTDYNPPDLYPKAAQQPLQFITMPDGTKLAAYLFLPADANGQAAAGPFPTILIQTGYNGGLGGIDSYMVRHGYATVVVDVRGTGQSEGSWSAFGADEQSDYGNTVDWVARQPFCDGRVALYGQSIQGIIALFTAAQNRPSVKALFPAIPVGDAYRDVVFIGGQASTLFIPLWFGAVSGAGVAQTDLLSNPDIALPALLQHLLSFLTSFQVPVALGSYTQDPAIAYDGPFWGLRSPLESDAKITVPTFIAGGLHDIFQRAEPLHYERIKGHAPVKLLMGPWEHIQLGQGLPADGVPPLDHIELQWFDHYVKGIDTGADRLPNVTQYVLGYGHYVTASDWPNPDAHAQRLYLHGDRSLSAATPAAGEPANTALQVPIEGLCSISTTQWTAGILGLLPLPCFTDDGTAEQLNVVYETPPMEADTYINGPIEADLWISTTAADAGLSVRIDDVAPGGAVTPLSNGLQTASLAAVDPTRSRKLDGQMIQPWHPYTQASELQVGFGAIVKVPVEVFETSALIAKGHRLRVAVGASNLPQGVPPVPTLLQELAGVLTIHSDGAHPSSVVIPVVATPLEHPAVE